jgi:hypothetical protein
MSRLPPALLSPLTPSLLAACIAVAAVVSGLDAPLVEDSLFWWVPKALLALEQGPAATYAHTLPDAVAAGLTPETTPPQWAGGLPDYAHPTLWYLWLAGWLSEGPTVQAVHLACILPAVLAALGFVEVGGRLGNRWAGLVPLAMPPVLAQMLRPELDLPLLAIVPWALLAVLDGRWRAFAVLGFLAPWMKEPGVLLIVPAVLRTIRERRAQPAALAPLAGLVAWGLVHGGLAQPERLPVTLLEWLQRDLWVALRLVFVEQGRWLLLLAIPFTWRRWRRGPAAGLTGGLVITWVVFFATVGFFAARGAEDLHTHIRYFLPGMALAGVLLGVRAPWLALPGLVWLHAASPFGPEASRYGTDAARAERAAAPWIEQRVAAGEAVWVGSYQAAGLTQPWAGMVDAPLSGFRMYAMDTAPEQIAVGDIVIVAAYGEPAGRLERGLTWETEESWAVREAAVHAYRVTGRQQPTRGSAPANPPPPGPVPPSGPPPR